MKEEQLSQPLHNGITPDIKSDDSPANDSDDRTSPSLLRPLFSERHQHSDQVSELKRERDSLKEQVQQLQSQLQELQRKVDMSHIEVKKEKEELDAKEGQNSLDYKSLFEDAKTKINDLIKDKEVLLATLEVKPSADQMMIRL
ncbi:hypothetical protein WMY93_002573 [Mugilogobius chulae]|uniref:Uncharacterized protein n=1 Tax=Mugilogobius chulae TaxID=88201 RepID=A0AAW0Q411_9GOBI